MYGLFCVHCKNVLISTDILWQVFHILYYNRTGITNVRTVDPRFVVPPIYGYEPFTEPVPLKYGKLATKYPRRIDGHFCSVRAVKFRVIVLYYTCVDHFVEQLAGSACVAGTHTQTERERKRERERPSQHVKMVWCVAVHSKSCVSCSWNLENDTTNGQTGMEHNEL